MPESTTVLLSTFSVILLELTSTAPPLLLSMAVTFDPTAAFRAVLVTLEFTAKPAATHVEVPSKLTAWQLSEAAMCFLPGPNCPVNGTVAFEHRACCPT